jgi:hypothetical protein
MYKNRINKAIEDAWELVPGNTYPIKDQLKGLGCRFGDRNGIRGWFFDPKGDHVNEVQKLAANPLANWLPLLGNTYEIKDELKGRFGARWSPEDSQWIVNPKVHKAASEFVQQQ